MEDEPMSRAGDDKVREPRADDPYRDCDVYLRHGACPCSTGLPYKCSAGDDLPTPPRAVDAWRFGKLDGWLAKHPEERHA